MDSALVSDRDAMDTALSFLRVSVYLGQAPTRAWFASHCRIEVVAKKEEINLQAECSAVILSSASWSVWIPLEVRAFFFITSRRDAVIQDISTLQTSQNAYGLMFLELEWGNHVAYCIKFISSWLDSFRW